MTSSQFDAYSGSSRSPSPAPSASACSSSGSRSSPAFSQLPDVKQSNIIGLVSDLYAYERLLQSLYAKGGELATAAILAQAGQNLSPVAGHQVLTALSNAQLMASTALGHIAQAHRELEMLARKLGIDLTAFGDVLKPPSAEGERVGIGLAT